MMSGFELPENAKPVEMKEAIDAFLNNSQKILTAIKDETGYYAMHSFCPSLLRNDYEIELQIIAEYILHGEWFIVGEGGG